MNESLNQLTTYFLIYKLSCLACGTLFCYLGYRLFLKGIYPNDSGFKWEGFKMKVYLTKVGPGIFFALFGAFIICFTIFQPLSFSVKPNNNAQESKVNDNQDIPHTLPDSLK